MTAEELQIELDTLYEKIEVLSRKVVELNNQATNLFSQLERINNQVNTFNHRLTLLERFIFLDHGALKAVYDKWAAEIKSEDDRGESNKS